MLRTFAMPAVLLAVASIVSIPTGAEAQKPDSDSVSKRLAVARSLTLSLETDAGAMTAAARKSRNGHGQVLPAQRNKILQDISRTKETVNELREIERIASPDQKAVIGRIAPLLRDLAHNAESSLDHLQSGPAAATSESFVDYLMAHEEIAKHLASLIVAGLEQPDANISKRPSE